MKKNLTNINIIVLALVLVILVVFIVKTIIDIRKINHDIYQKRAVLETKYQQGLSLNDTIKQIEESAERLNKINNIILSSDNTLDFINDIEITAENLNLEQNIKLTEFEKPNVITPFPLQISLKGNYINILKYINQLDNKVYYINFYTITFTNQSSGGTSLNQGSNANLEANIYWQ